MNEPDDFWRNKAEVLKKSGKFEEALKAYDKAAKIEDEKKQADSWFKKAIDFSEIGDYEKALECLENDLKFNRSSFQTLFEKGIIFCLSKKYPEALECFNKAYESTFDDFLDSSNKIEKLKEHKKYEKAVLMSDKAMGVKPISQKFWHFKGIVLHEMKQFEDAIKCFNEGMASGQEFAELFYDLAKSQLMIGRVEECIDSLEKACKIDSALQKALSIDSTFKAISENQKFRQIRDFGKLISD